MYPSKADPQFTCNSDWFCIKYYDTIGELKQGKPYIFTEEGWSHINTNLHGSGVILSDSCEEDSASKSENK